MDGQVRVMPGTVPRNGLPGFRPYVYRGLGYDQMEARLRREAGLRAAETRRRRLAEAAGTVR